MPFPTEDLPGRGPPVVLLHGVLDTPEVWRPVARRVAEAGRAVRLVRTTPTPAWSPQEDVDKLAATLAGPAHVVGHSRGATLACWLALERPDLVASLGVVASPPQASEVFRARFRKMISSARSPDEEACLRWLAQIPDDAFPGQMMRGFRGRALVVEAGEDPLYSPTCTMFWRLFLPYADFERVEGDHRSFLREAGAAWLADRLLRHIDVAEASD